MAWLYRSGTGDLFHNGAKVTRGYSGFAQGYNNPDLDHMKSVGPIPRGHWTIEGPPFDTESHGPYVLRLQPRLVDLHGRSGFLIHGDSKTRPGEASHGCIILPRWAREQVWNSDDRELEVQA